MPKPSPPFPPAGSRLGMAKTLASSSQRSRSAALTAPSKLTASARPAAATACSNPGRSGPSPTTTQRVPGTRARIRGSASIITSWPL